MFNKGHSVTVLPAGLNGARGVVHRRYFRGDGSKKNEEVVYHVFVASLHNPSLPGDNPFMLTVSHDQLRPPSIGWGVLSAEYQWWLNPFNAHALNATYWPAPAAGWKKGDFVSIPSPSFAVYVRICARVVEPEDATGCITVVFKPPFDPASLVRSKLPARAVLGPHTDWTLDHREWASEAKAKPSPPPAASIPFKPIVANTAAAKRPRSVSPLSLGENAIPGAVAEKKMRVLSMSITPEASKSDQQEETRGPAESDKQDDNTEDKTEASTMDEAPAAAPCYDWHLNEDVEDVDEDIDVAQFFNEDE